MKIKSLILLLIFISCKDSSYKQEEGVLYEGQCIAVPDYYRELYGFDSVQLTHKLRVRFEDKYIMEANFCYPNKWHTYKIQKDTVFVHDTIVVYKNKASIKTINQTGGQTGETIINN